MTVIQFRRFDSATPKDFPDFQVHFTFSSLWIIIRTFFKDPLRKNQLFTKKNIWKLRYGRNAHAIDPNAGLSPSSKTWNPAQQAAWVTIFDINNSFQVSSAKSCLLARSHATLTAGEEFYPTLPNGCFFGRTCWPFGPVEFIV